MKRVIVKIIEIFFPFTYNRYELRRDAKQKAMQKMLNSSRRKKLDDWPNERINRSLREALNAYQEGDYEKALKYIYSE